MCVCVRERGVCGGMGSKTWRTGRVLLKGRGVQRVSVSFIEVVLRGFRGKRTPASRGQRPSCVLPVSGGETYMVYQTDTGIRALSAPLVTSTRRAPP